MKWENPGPRENTVRLTVMPTPTYEPFQTVTIAAGGSGFSMETKLTPDEARACAAELVRWADVVERDA